MIYLDYSATTPVSYEVLESYNKATKDYVGNAHSLHLEGIKSSELLNSATEQICGLFNVASKEIIYTSGATEANNMALKGIALAYENRGNHIIVSKLEHPSIYSICSYLETIGFEISYVNNTEEGLIDFEDLKKKIKSETILVSICAVNSEMGIRQPLKTIRQIIKKENNMTIFHSDITQGLGKVPINLHDVDLASMSAHKIFGPKGIGFLYKAEKVNIVPLIHGSSKSSDLRPGTAALPLVVAMSKAIRIALSDLDKRESYVGRLNEKIITGLTEFPNIKINKTSYSIPHILNVSLMNIKPETFIHALEKHDVYIGTNTACSSSDLSTAVMAVYNDTKRAVTTLRICISYVTTTEEITRFLSYFKNTYEKLTTLGE